MSRAANTNLRDTRFAIARAPLAFMLRTVQSGSGKSIVLVDDEGSFNELMSEFLREHFACPIHTFTNPLALLEALPSLEIGMLVTDYYMPRLDGLAVIRRVAETLPHTPCILITGHRLDDDDEELTLPEQVRELLPKPFRWQELARVIEKHWPGGERAPLQANAVSLHG